MLQHLSTPWRWGASGVDRDGGNHCGAVYVFERPQNGWAGTLLESAKLSASDAAPFQYLGPVATCGDTITARSPGRDCSAGFACGAAYVFRKPPGGWTGTVFESARLMMSDPRESGGLGRSAAMSDSTIVLGAEEGYVGAESVYVFQEPAGGWVGEVTESEQLRASDLVSGSDLGKHLALEGETLVAGAPAIECDLGPECGAAHVFELAESEVFSGGFESGDFGFWIVFPHKSTHTGEVVPWGRC